MRPAGVFAALCIACLSGAMLAIAQQRDPSEMVQNGDFEAGMTGWSYVARGDAKGSVQLVSENPLNDKSPHSLRMEVTQLGDACGVANSGASGMNVSAGRWYDVTFCARKEDGSGVGLVFSLESEDGKNVCARTTLPEIGRGGIGAVIEGSNQWRQYTVSLHAYASNAKCRLVIWPVEPATLFLDEISLQPRK